MCLIKYSRELYFVLTPEHVLSKSNISTVDDHGCFSLTFL